jgi:tetratricopeptide (TPR) repeat protein
MSLRDLLTAKPLLMRALNVARQLDDTYQTALALTRLGYTMMVEPKGLAMAEEGLALFREVHDKHGIAHALTIIGEIARFNGDGDRARRAYEEALVLYRQISDTRGTLITYLNLAFVAQRESDYRHGRDLARQALNLAHTMELRSEMAECLLALAGMIGMTGQPQLAAHLFGTADSELKRLGAHFDPVDRPEFDSLIAAVRDQLHDASFHAAWIEGKQMRLEQAVDFALRACFES